MIQLNALTYVYRESQLKIKTQIKNDLSEIIVKGNNTF
jgi:hypothetical protein